MNDQAAQLLAQLRDIHGVAEPSLWPPAPGWWVLAVLLMLLLAWLLRSLFRKLAVRRRRQQWMTALTRIEHSHANGDQERECLAELNRLFRAVALRAFPDTACASLEGKAWVEFIRSLLPEIPAGQEEDGLAALVSGPYERMPVYDSSALFSTARQWVKRYG